jgi:aryl-alcohol dehydrogenase-like predicted oxidoreductase
MASVSLSAAGCDLSWAATDEILKRPIPHGKEMLPVIGLGTAIVFNVGPDEAKRAALGDVVQTLLNGGGSLIDTATSYGTSEEVVGAIATGTSLRDRIFVATKLEARDEQAGRVEFAQSLARLRVKTVDLLMLHNVRENDPGLDFFRALKSEGLTRFFGATTTFRRDYEAVEALIRREKPDFIEVDCSIANREAEARIIPAAADVGTAVLIALPFGRSSLFSRVKGKPLPPVAEEIGAVTWGQVFLQYLLGNAAITAVIPGTNKAEHMADNLGAGHGSMPDPKQRQALVTYFEQLR